MLSLISFIIRSLFIFPYGEQIVLITFVVMGYIGLRTKICKTRDSGFSFKLTDSFFLLANKFLYASNNNNNTQKNIYTYNQFVSVWYLEKLNIANESPIRIPCLEWVASLIQFKDDAISTNSMRAWRVLPNKTILLELKWMLIRNRR